MSAKVEDEIILALKDKFPMINSPLSSGNIEDLETVAIYSTKLQNGKDKTYGAAKTYINKNVFCIVYIKIYIHMRNCQ